MDRPEALMNGAGILKKTTILVLVLIVPGFLYYLLVAEGKNRYLPLPVFGPKSLEKTTHRKGHKEVPDTLFHTLPDFSLTDQNGNTVAAKTFAKKIFIANFFYTRCPGVCSQMNKNISQLVINYANNPMIYFLSTTVDPQHDSVEVLKNYAGSFKPASSRWLFLTGDTSTIYNLARKGFLVDALQTGKEDFIYSDKLILVDEDKRIRGYYTGASADDVNRLNDEIKVLIKEELLKNDSPLY